MHYLETVLEHIFIGIILTIALAIPVIGLGVYIHLLTQ
tara:strand:- start:327 stop:440 length:114 start_codon:yes stop_codon:yes gene_type:complete